MKCDICGKESGGVEICMCKQCANEFNKGVNCIKRDLEIYKRALELVCKEYIDVDAISYVLVDNEDYFDKSDEQIQKETIDYFVSQAKKELEEQDVKD